MITTHVMNSTSTNVGGWETSEMRTYVNNDVYNSLPSDLQSVIKTVNKVSDVGNKDTSTLKTTEDKLFLLSAEEVGYSASYQVNGQGTKYEIYSDNASRIKYNLSGSADRWWLRSTYTYATRYFFNVGSGGGRSYDGADSTYGVAPAFCI